LKSVFASSVQEHAAALLVTSAPLLSQMREQIVGLAAQHAMPAIYFEREFVVAGGLMSYGAPLRDNYHQAALYVGQLLKGAKPSDLPVVQGTKIDWSSISRPPKPSALSFPLRSLSRPTR